MRSTALSLVALAGCVSGHTITTINVAATATISSHSTGDTVYEGNPVTIIGTAADSDNLTFTTTDPTNGELTGTPPVLTYTPDDDYVGIDSFTVTADDGNATDDALITIEVTAANDAPSGDAQSVTLGQTQDSAVKIVFDRTDSTDPVKFANGAYDSQVILGEYVDATSEIVGLDVDGILNVRADISLEDVNVHDGEYGVHVSSSGTPDSPPPSSAATHYSPAA